MELPNVGRILLEDAETGECLMLNSSDKDFLMRYKEHAKTAQESFIQNLRRRGIDNFQFSTDSDYVKSLREFFHLRGNRRGK